MTDSFCRGHFKRPISLQTVFFNRVALPKIEGFRVRTSVWYGQSAGNGCDTGSTKNKELRVSPKIPTTASLRGNASDTKSNGNHTRLC